MGAATFSVLFTVVPPVLNNVHASTYCVPGTILGKNKKQDSAKQDKDLMEPYFLMVSELTKYQGVICTKNIKGKGHKVKKGNQIRPLQK